LTQLEIERRSSWSIGVRTQQQQYSSSLYRSSTGQARSRSTKFEHSNAIGSSAFFNKEEKLPTGQSASSVALNNITSTIQSTMQSADVGQLKESVRNVAGRLSNAANNFYNSIPVNL